MSWIKEGDDIVISGFERGIGDSPHPGATPLLGQYGIGGISDMRNLNLISIPGEASVNFATALNSNPIVASGTVVSANAGADTITITGASGLTNGSAVVFAGGSLPAGIVAGTVYWLAFVSTGVYEVHTSFNILGDLLNITSDGSGTFTVYNITAPPKYSITDLNKSTWIVDGNGYVWSNEQLAGTSWRFTGNTTTSGGTGQGLVYYVASDNTSYVFVYRAGFIDYVKLNTNFTLNSWIYGWNPNDGTTGNVATYLKSTTSNHEAMVGADNRVYYCDGSWIGSWYQTDPTIAFVPTTTSTYTFSQTQVIPFTDTAQCLTQLGTTLLIGGTKNIIYPWDRFSASNSYPIFVAENNIQKMVTVNTNAFALVGNRGRIYYTNGSQAVLFKKIPDHISGTVEPYFTWGGLTSIKNQIYFSASATTNAGVPISQYGGVWAVDVDTKAIRLTNKLSYGTYAGFATALVPNFATNPAGTGLYIGWDSGASTYGIDITTSAPYTNGEATIDSDLISIGTFLKPTTNGRVEFKLVIPIVSGESVKLQYRKLFSDSYTDINSNITLDFSGIASGTWNGYSYAYQSVPFENSQWIQIRAVLTSTASSPSYCRLFELRIGN